MRSFQILFIILVLLFQFPSSLEAKLRRKSRQTADFNEGGLPSHLPSPPEHPDENEVMPPGGIGNGQNFFREFPWSPSFTMQMQEFDEKPPGGAGGKPEPPPPPPPPPPSPSGPLGLAGTILILVPEFKIKIYRFPAWFGASVKLSFPITIFFDMLAFPPGSPTFPFPFGGPPRIRRKMYGRVGRGKRSPAPGILSLPPPNSLKGGERALLFPKLENFLNSAGIPAGRDCLLRTVCEVHETALQEGYGLLGDIITLLFSISKSAYADTHLPEYLAAEESGKSGNCSAYTEKCPHSIFRPDDGAAEDELHRNGHENQHCEAGRDGERNFCV